MAPKIYRSRGLEVILAAKSRCVYIGKEYERPAVNPLIRRYLSQGCERLVIYENGKAVSALQIMIGPSHPTVANVFTKVALRRKGYARSLWEEATKHHSVILHSSNLSELGSIFAGHCK